MFKSFLSDGADVGQLARRSCSCFGQQAPRWIHRLSRVLDCLFRGRHDWDGSAMVGSSTFVFLSSFHLMESSLYR